jgi:flagellar motility protein MotE (MotC chaperone)
VLKLKDIIALGLLAVVSFPMVLLGVLLWTGNVRMVFGPEADDPNARARLLERPEDIPGATVVDGASGTGDANRTAPGSGEELDQREAEVLREIQRLEDLRSENQAIRDAITAERERLEKLLLRGDSLESRRSEVLAATFTGMKPDQAAKILAALDDILVTAILRKVADDKPRAKMLAALSKIDVQRAAHVTRLLDNDQGRSRMQGPPAESAATRPGNNPNAADSGTSAVDAKPRQP